MDGDKRAASRFSFSRPVGYAMPHVTINGSVAGNISISGISLRVQKFIPMGTLLELQMRLGDSPKVIWVQAQVVRIREILSEDCFEVGLKFVQDEQCTKAVGEYISACRPPTTQPSKAGFLK